MHKSLLLGVTLTAAIAATAAQAAEFGRPVTATIVTNNQSSNQLNDQSIKSALPRYKQVYLMNIKLTPQEKQHFINYHANTSHLFATANSSLPKKADQGMNNVPVLDQGRHGSCVTFANTAAMDALLGKGDYVSQLCSLELGAYLEKRSYLPSGWEGTTGGYVLNQLLQFGIVNKGDEKSRSCAGVNEYPTEDESNTGNPITLDDYKQLSESLTDKVYWEPIMTFAQRISWTEATTPAKAQATLDNVKQTLTTKEAGADARVTFAVILPVSHCHAGACAKVHVANDTWAYTDEIKNDSNPQLGGHEMVIVGYDDNAVATDKEGKQHKGLLTLRNSWGSDAGDHGNYYMTYEFFKQYVMEVQKLAYMPQDQN